MKLKISPLFQFGQSHRLLLWVSFGFILFLLAAPEITKLMIPCMRPVPGSSYISSACTMDIVFTNYLLLILAAFAGVVIAVFISGALIKIKELLIFAVFLGILMISAFHLSIAGFEATIKKAPILLFDEKTIQPERTK